MNQKTFSIPANWRRPKTSYVNPSQKSFLDKKDEEFFSSLSELEAEKHDELRSRLLRLGGDKVCTTFEEDIDDILQRAEPFKGTKSRIKKGRDCRCHQNASYLWQDFPQQYRIATGWALSRDGIWRQHSWVVELLVNWEMSGYHIVETTLRRLVYYGFVMDSDECAEFARKNAHW
jgi:hypothetical protein